MSKAIRLGDKVRDVVTGMVGIATSRAKNLTGCDTVWIAPAELKDGRAIEGAWFDVNRVEIVQAGAVKLPSVPRDETPSAG